MAVNAKIGFTVKRENLAEINFHWFAHPNFFTHLILTFSGNSLLYKEDILEAFNFHGFSPSAEIAKINRRWYFLLLQYVKWKLLTFLQVSYFLEWNNIIRKAGKCLIWQVSLIPISHMRLVFYLLHTSETPWSSGLMNLISYKTVVML